MKEFFKNKVNIVLMIILIVLLSLGVVLGYQFFRKPDVVAIDFSKMSETEVVDWANQNEVSDKLEIKHEYDEEIESGKVIYQSVKEGNKIEEKILIIISDGPDLTDYIEIPYETIKTKDALDNWFKEYGFSNVNYEFVDDKTYEAGYIISVDPVKAKKEDYISIKVASGEYIEVPDFAYYTEADAKKWSKDNNVTVTYKYETSSKKSGTLLSQNPKAGEKVSSGSTVVVTLSSGTISKATIPDTYLGISEEKFLANLKALGFTSFDKDDTTYFSVTSAKGTIFSYDDGEFPLTETINYAISEGKYTFDEEEYNNRNKDKVEALVKAYDNRNAHLTLTLKETTTSDVENNNVYDCKSSYQYPNTTVSCKLAVNNTSKNNNTESKVSTNTSAYINPNSYFGESEANFLSSLKKLGFTNFKNEGSIYSRRSEGTICYYLPDGTQTLDTTITYKLSLGSYANNFDESEYNGKTLNEAKSVISDHNNKGANISLSTTTVATSSYTEGSLYDCSLNSNVVSCKLASKVAEEVKSVNVLSASALRQSLNSDPLNYQNTYDNVYYYFVTSKGFSNVTISEESSNLEKGAIISVSINGSTDFSESTFKVNLPVIVKISSGS